MLQTIGDLSIGISGSFGAEPVGNPALTTISSFPKLTRVDGTLRVIESDMLTTISGFGVLQTIGQDFDINNNAQLTTLSGFDVLLNVEGNFTVRGNPALSSCCGLFRIANASASVVGTTDISGNATECNTKSQIATDCAPSLPPSGVVIDTDLPIGQNTDVPFNVTSITRITGDLTISGTITAFPNFAALKVVEGDIAISVIITVALTELSDIFPALDSVRGNLFILINNHLKTITGFAELDSVGGDLGISGNKALTTIPTFDALTKVGKALYVHRNPLLPTFSGFGRS